MLNIPSHFFYFLACHTWKINDSGANAYMTKLSEPLVFFMQDGAWFDDPFIFECQYLHEVWTKVFDMCNIQIPYFKLKQIIEYHILHLQN